MILQNIYNSIIWQLFKTIILSTLQIRLQILNSHDVFSIFEEEIGFGCTDGVTSLNLN